MSQAAGDSPANMPVMGDPGYAPTNASSKGVGEDGASAPAASPIIGMSASEVASADMDDAASLAIILGVLAESTRTDISHVSPSTIVRRIASRMAFRGTRTWTDYAHLMRIDPDEGATLAREIVMSKTGFHRDRPALGLFALVVLPAILHRDPPQKSYRIWVVGCGTGEEAYELAMDVMDSFRGTAITTLQIFATDINDASLTTARQGYYPPGIVDHVPAERLARYFTKDRDGYRISREIRDLCVFAKHDVTVDTPFSRMDVIRCGTLLRRLVPAAQHAVLSTFQYALSNGGYLLLKAPHAIDIPSSLFDTIAPDHGLYRSRLPPGRPTAAPSRAEVAPRPAFPPRTNRQPPTLQQTADRIVLGRFVPAGVLVTDALEIIHCRGNGERFLEPTRGNSMGNVLQRMPISLRSALDDAVREAQQRRMPVRRERLSTRREQGDRTIALEVIPVSTPLGSAGYLILFEEPPREDGQAGPCTAPGDVVDIDRSQVSLLREELAQARRELSDAHSLVLDLEEQKTLLAEQLKESLDETQSSSEEFLSTNEELQIAREEVESTNQALITLNKALLATNSDLSAASAAIRLSGELTSTIVETMQYPLVILSGSFIIERTNQAFLHVFGGDRLQTVGRSIFEVGQSMWNIPAIHRLLEDDLPTTTQVDDFEFTHDLGHLGERTIRIAAHRIQPSGSRERQIMLVLTDITHQVHVLNDLKSTAHELMRSNADLDHFAVVASHDLQEPLGVVSLYLEILKLQYGSLFDDQAHKYMANVTDGTLRMTEMIRGILAFSRPGNQGVEMVPVDSKSIVEVAKDNLALSISKSCAVITQDELPTIRAQPEQITQVFQNVIGNALKYCKAKGRPVIHIGCRESDHAWTFTIADNGIGVKKKDYAAIFQPFHRVHTDRFVKGYGIGLATCRKIVERHKGRMWVDSAPGKGSTFSFTIAKS